MYEYECGPRKSIGSLVGLLVVLWVSLVLPFGGNTTVEISMERLKMKLNKSKTIEFSDGDSGHEDEEDEDLYKRQLAYPPFPVYDPPSTTDSYNKKVHFDLKSSSDSDNNLSQLPIRNRLNPLPPFRLNESQPSEKSEEEDEEEYQESELSDVTEKSDTEDNHQPEVEEEEEEEESEEVEEDEEEEEEEEVEELEDQDDKEDEKCSEAGKSDNLKMLLKSESVDPEQKYSEHDMEFAVMLDDFISKMHETKLQASDKTDIANKLSEYISKVNPPTLTKNLSQLVPLITSIASENNFTTSLSILNTINILSSRFKDLNSPNCDLTWLIRRLCTFSSESRSTLRTEGFLVLKNVIAGFGIDYVLQPFIYILSDFGVKGGGRIKSVAMDALSYSLILFPRNSFDFSLLSEWACKMLWNSKRRVRQAAFELIALIVHSIGTPAALALFREYLDRPMASSTQSSSENITEVSPLSAITARISRHVLPTLSHSGLVDYGLVIPFEQIVKKRNETTANEAEEKVLQPVRSGNKSQRTAGADVDWILQAKGPLVRSSIDHVSGLTGTEKTSELEDVSDPLEKLSHHVYSSSSASSNSSQRNPLPSLYSSNEIKHFEPSFQQTFQVYRMEGLYNKWESGTPSTPQLHQFQQQSPNPAQQPQVESRDQRLFSKNWKSSLDITSGDEFGPYPESDFLYRKPVLARQLRNNRKESPKNDDIQLQDVSSVSSRDSERISDDFLANLKVTDYAAIAIPTTKKVTQRRPKKIQTRNPNEKKTKVKVKEETNTLQKCLAKLNAADWLVNIEGFANLTKLMETEDLKPELALINKTALKHLTNLRSQVCRAACNFFKDLFHNYGKNMETDCEKIVEKLLDKTCDVNKFIREDASLAVLEACDTLSYLKIFSCFEAFGVRHRNPVVRATTARMISHLVNKHGLEKSMDISDRLLPVLTRFLQEGSLETRTHAKETLGVLMGDMAFDEKLKRFVSPELLRSVSKNLNAIRNRL